MTLSVSCHSLLVWRLSIERSAIKLMGMPLCVICCFCLAAFYICSLCLIFVNLINMCLGVFHLGFILFGTLWISWTWVIISFPMLGKFSTIISSSIFSWSSFLFSSSETPMNWMLGHLTLSRGLWDFPHFNSFFCFPVCFIYFYHSIFYLTYPISAFVILLLFPPECFWSHLLHYSLYIDSFFTSSRSLLNISCIFTILVSRPFICNSILFSRFWIHYLYLNSFSGRFPISSSFVWFGGHLSCSFTCWVFLWLFILFRLLCLGWPFCLLTVCGFYLLWRLLAGWGWMGGLSRFPC